MTYIGVHIINLHLHIDISAWATSNNKKTTTSTAHTRAKSAEQNLKSRRAAATHDAATECRSCCCWLWNRRLSTRVRTQFASISHATSTANLKQQQQQKKKRNNKTESSMRLLSLLVPLRGRKKKTPFKCYAVKLPIAPHRNWARRRVHTHLSARAHTRPIAISRTKCSILMCLICVSCVCVWRQMWRIQYLFYFVYRFFLETPRDRNHAKRPANYSVDAPSLPWDFCCP